MKKLLSVIFCVALLFSFSACSDSKDTSEAKKAAFEVKLEFNKEKSVNSKVCVNTTLPVGTLLDVDVWVGDKFHSTETVKVQADETSNFFITSSQKDLDGNDIEDGRYILSINMLKESKQPTNVLEKIGQNGEYMKGENVYNTNNGRIVKLNKPIEKKGGQFTMPE